jgi:hypothetical protein
MGWFMAAKFGETSAAPAGKKTAEIAARANKTCLKTDPLHATCARDMDQAIVTQTRPGAWNR